MKRMTASLIIGCLIGWLVACSHPTSPSVATVTTPTSQPVAPTSPDESSCPPASVTDKVQMRVSRAAHTATLLPEGTVLLTGGFSQGEQAVASADIFHPETDSFSAISPMSVARQSHTATLLPEGKVLLAGGFNGDYLATAELYDPATGSFTPTGTMTAARSGHVAVLLNNGKVLLAGGTGEGWTFLATAELYDPETALFSTTGAMTLPRESHTATLLNSGRVLVAGGHQGRRAAITIYDSAELYDPGSGTFTPTGSMAVKRHKHDATLLADGRVFVSGGADERDEQGAYNSTEIFDPATGMFTPAPEMHSTRYKHTGTSLRLQNGQVLLVGGASITEIFDPQSGTLRKLADGVGITRFFATATMLATGEILFAGGYGPGVAAGTQAWLLSACLR